jgi:hypothetical protein
MYLSALRTHLHILHSFVLKRKPLITRDVQVRIPRIKFDHSEIRKVLHCLCTSVGGRYISVKQGTISRDKKINSCYELRLTV